MWNRKSPPFRLSIWRLNPGFFYIFDWGPAANICDHMPCMNLLPLNKKWCTPAVVLNGPSKHKPCLLLLHPRHNCLQLTNMKGSLIIKGSSSSSSDKSSTRYSGKSSNPLNPPLVPHSHPINIVVKPVPVPVPVPALPAPRYPTPPYKSVPVPAPQMKSVGKTIWTHLSICFNLILSN